MNLKINDKLKNLLPPLTAEERQALRDSIEAEGLRDAILIWDGVIVDGHNRYEICRELGIEIKTTDVSFESENEAEVWIIQNNLARRNLNKGQFRYYYGLWHETDKKESHDGGKGKNRSGGQNVPHLKTAEIIAKKTGVNARTVKRAAKEVRILKQSNQPEVERLVIAGKVSPQTAVKIVEMPADEIPEIVEVIKTAPDVLTAERSIKPKITEIKRKKIVAENNMRAEELRKKPIPVKDKKYDVIVVDPPWDIKKIEREVTPEQAGFEYPTMTVDEIKNIEIPAAENCHLFLWTTQKYLPDAFEILKHWGFKYVLTMVWHKNGGFQPFNLPQYNNEFILYGRKGTPIFTETKDFFTCFNADRKAHSEKPEKFYNIIKRVTSGLRIDMFNRRRIDGFESWGDEAE